MRLVDDGINFEAMSLKKSVMRRFLGIRFLKERNVLFPAVGLSRVDGMFGFLLFKLRAPEGNDDAGFAVGVGSGVTLNAGHFRIESQPEVSDGHENVGFRGLSGHPRAT